MRVELNLPETKEFVTTLENACKKVGRKRKNYLENIVVEHVNALRGKNTVIVKTKKDSKH